MAAHHWPTIPADGPPTSPAKPSSFRSRSARRAGGSHHRNERRSYLTATLDSVLEPSPDRIAPGCEYYGRCGGCHYQHADYAAQLAMKRSILIETLERARVAVPADIRVLSAEPWAYRNRIRLHVDRGPQPSLQLPRSRLASRPARHPLPGGRAAAPAGHRRLQSAPPAATRARSTTSPKSNSSAPPMNPHCSSRSSHKAKRWTQLPRSIAEALLPPCPCSKACASSRSIPRHAARRPSAAWGQPSLEYAVGALQYGSAQTPSFR